jgi:hypothetical protein
MSRLHTVRSLDDCLDSVIVKEFVVDPPIDETLMRDMSIGAKLQYFPHFPKPYFRIDRPRGYVIQGIIGNRRFRVTFSPSAEANVEEQLRQVIESAPFVGRMSQ